MDVMTFLAHHTPLSEDVGVWVDGLVHLHHLTPKPPGYPYPYPDFFQVVYLAEAEAFVPKAKLTGDYEVESFWIPIEEAKRLDLTSCERLYLDIVVKPKPRTRRGRIHTVAASRKLGCRMH